MAAPEGTRLLPQPRHPFRRRAEHEAGHQNAAPPVASGAIGLRERGGEKRSLTSPGARRIRSATAATEPRRHPDPAAAAVLRNLESRRPKARPFPPNF